LFGWKFTDYGPDYTSFADGRIAGGFARADQRSTIKSGGVLVVFYHPAWRRSGSASSISAERLLQISFPSLAGAGFISPSRAAMNAQSGRKIRALVRS
jgi:hypothetical protein